MQSIHNLKENIFSECQNYLVQIGKIESPGDLIHHYSSIANLQEKVQFLKNISEVELNFSSENSQFLAEKDLAVEMIQEVNEKLKTEYWEILQQKELEISELSAKIKILENHEIQKIAAEFTAETIFAKMPLENAFAIVSETEEKEENNESENLKVEIAEGAAEVETVEEQIKLIQEKEYEERRRKIVEFNKVEGVTKEPSPIYDEFKNETITEKKFRLGKIKGLGIVKSLFDDDFLEEKPFESVPEKSLHNSNMSTDFMEAEKFKQDFRIDLNDKVAFTKVLFHGDEQELRNTVNQLNSYKTLEGAKEYLSELYYTKDWKNVDDYAQRLWVLVENKFI